MTLSEITEQFIKENIGDTPPIGFHHDQAVAVRSFGDYLTSQGYEIVKKEDMELVKKNREITESYRKEGERLFPSLPKVPEKLKLKISSSPVDALIISNRDVQVIDKINEILTYLERGK